MLLRKATGGSTVLGYTWEHDGDVVEVPDDIAAELLSIRGAGFSQALAEPEPRPVITEPAPRAEVTEPAPKAKAEVTEGPARDAAAK